MSKHSYKFIQVVLKILKLNMTEKSMLNHSTMTLHILQGILLVHDISKPQSFEHVEEWLTGIRQVNLPFSFVHSLYIGLM